MKARVVGAQPAQLASLGLKDASAILDDRIAAFQWRIDLCAQKRHRRFLPALGMLLSGGYRNFSGWKSAIKDIIRP